MQVYSVNHTLDTLLRNYSVYPKCFTECVPSLHEVWISSEVRGLVGCSLYATTQAAARCQQFCRVSNVLQNFLCYSDCSSVTSILLTTHKAPGTDHGNTVLQFRLAVSHPFYKPPTKPLVQTTVTQYYNSDWQSHIHSINLPQSPGTDHGNTVLQLRLAVSHPFY